ncbi:MAG: recombination-associated protein RdgC [Candidatus Sumerlaeaceae bacterium]|nr:recombination-associated protein RdgC [Candidatus Sumerlaeaceae bacterium]
MAFIHGSITYLRFRPIDPLPRNFKDLLSERLPKYAFREINPKTNPEFSTGWINAMNPIDTRLTIEKALFGPYVILGVRRDRKSVPAALLRARLSEAVRAQLRERRAKKLSREDVQQLRDTVREEMLAAVSPSTSLHEMIWNIEKQAVYYSTRARKAVEEFIDLFSETFDMTLEEVNLVNRIEGYISERGLDVELDQVEPAVFARR